MRIPFVDFDLLSMGDLPLPSQQHRLKRNVLCHYVEKWMAPDNIHRRYLHNEGRLNEIFCLQRHPRVLGARPRLPLAPMVHARRVRVLTAPYGKLLLYRVIHMVRQNLLLTLDLAHMLLVGNP